MVQGVTRIQAEKTSTESQRLREVSQEFESFFLEMALKQMRRANQALSSEQASFGRSTYEGWQDEQMARAIARSGGIGLGEVLYRQLQQQQMAREQGKTWQD